MANTDQGRWLIYLLFFVLAMPHPGIAQLEVKGLGRYVIGLTTPDSLRRTSFTEEESYVKGTIALPCTHIRTFRADTIAMAGIAVTDLVLAFYDDVLFYISSDYSDVLKKVFAAQCGSGVQQPTRRLPICKDHAPLSIRITSWPGADNQALVIDRTGYTEECRQVAGATLTIFNQSIWALSSACDLKHTDPLLEEFMKRNE